MKPYYQLTQAIHDSVFELIRACEKTNLGYVKFYHHVASDKKEGEFSLSEYHGYWELVVSVGANRDIYKVAEGKINYNYSEHD